MDLVNRSAIVLKPKRPYLEWTKHDDIEGLAESVFDSFDEEPSLYLLPVWEDESSRQQVLEQFWTILFEAMLADWLTDPAGWPKKRTYKMFQEWFEIQMIFVVEDLYLDEPLEILD